MVVVEVVGRLGQIEKLSFVFTQKTEKLKI